MRPARVVLLRHAQALSRGTWEGADRDRPLSGRGRRQAEQIATWDALRGADAIVSSAAARCLETVAPLATAIGLAVVEDDRLREAGPSAELDDIGSALRLAGRCDAVVRSLAEPGRTFVLCSHGDVIPCYLEFIAARDGAKVDSGRCAKGSAWVLEYSGCTPLSAEYVSPGI